MVPSPRRSKGLEVVLTPSPYTARTLPRVRATLLRVRATLPRVKAEHVGRQIAAHTLWWYRTSHNKRIGHTLCQYRTVCVCVCKGVCVCVSE
eukprot:116752-Rhodomonas_salina.1